MKTTQLIVASLLFIISACNTKETDFIKACPYIGGLDSLKVKINLNTAITDFKVLVDNVEVSMNCEASIPCIVKQNVEENLLSLSIVYLNGKLPGKVDFTLIENSDPEVVRIEAFDVQLTHPAPGGEVENQDCDFSKEALIEFSEEQTFQENEP